MPDPWASWTPEQGHQAEALFQMYPEDPDLAVAVPKYLQLQERKAVQRPGELIQPQAPGLFGFLKHLPLAMGGGVTHFEKPTDEDFQKAVPRPEGMSEGDYAQARSDYEDKLWAQMYDKAKAEGRSISRAPGETDALHDAYKAPGMKQLAGDAMALGDGYVGVGGPLMKAGAKVAGDALQKADEFIFQKPASRTDIHTTAGDDAVKWLNEAEGTVGPADRLAMGVAGSLLPGSPLAKIIGRFAPKGKGVISGALGGIGKGAMSAAAIGSGEDIGKGIQEAFTDKQDKGALERIKEIGMDIATALPGRLGAGAILGGIGGAGGGYSRGLRDSNKPSGNNLIDFETADGKTDFWEPGGLLNPPKLQAMIDGRVPFTNVQDIAANEAAIPFLKGAQAKAGEVLGPIAAETEAAHKVYDSLGSKANTSPMVKTLVRLMESRTFQEGDAPAGQDLPVFNNSELRKQLGRAADISIDNDQKAQMLAEGTNGVRVPLSKALQMGIADMGTEVTVSPKASVPTGSPREMPTVAGGVPVMDKVGNIRLKLGDALEQKLIDPQAMSIVFRPRDLDARAVDSIISEVDRAAGMSESAGAGKADPMYRHLVRSAREMRDQFPPIPGITDKYPDATITGPDGEPMTLTGRSAMAHAHAEQIGALRSALKRAGGFSDTVDPTHVGDQEKAQQAMFRVGGGVGNTNLTREILDMASREKGGEDAVKTAIAANLRGGSLVREDPKVPQTMNPVRQAQQLEEMFKYRLDPMASALGRAGPRAAGILGADPLTRALTDLARRTQQEHK